MPSCLPQGPIHWIDGRGFKKPPRASTAIKMQLEGQIGRGVIYQLWNPAKVKVVEPQLNVIGEKRARHKFPKILSSVT
jgi:hypothetical protein